MTIGEILTGVAAVLTSIGSLIAAIIAARKASTVANEVKPNGGGSLSDAVARIENMVRSQGHQIGEIRRDAVVTHEQLGNSLHDLQARVRRLEN